jgi:hypothetical protein
MHMHMHELERRRDSEPPYHCAQQSTPSNNAVVNGTTYQSMLVFLQDGLDRRTVSKSMFSNRLGGWTGLGGSTSTHAVVIFSRTDCIRQNMLLQMPRR